MNPLGEIVILAILVVTLFHRIQAIGCAMRP